MVSVSPSSPSYPTPTSPPAQPVEKATARGRQLMVDPAGASPLSTTSSSYREAATVPDDTMQVNDGAGEDTVKQASLPTASLASSQHLSLAAELFPLPPKPTESLPSPALSTLPTSLPPKPSASQSPPSARHPFPLPPRPDAGVGATAPPASADIKPTLPCVVEALSPDSTRSMPLKPESPFSPPPQQDADLSDSFKREASTSTIPSPNPFASTSSSPSDSASDDDDSSRESTPRETVTRRGSKSPKKSASSAGTPRSRGKKVKIEDPEPQLIGHLPDASDEALSSFIEVSNCTYATKALGDLAYFDSDSAQCDCVHYDGYPELEQACGEESSCMNRLMQIECVQGDCKCGDNCQNQRFQRKEYAKIDIVKTEKKGYGVRTSTDLAADSFVYEYVGEVIGPTAFAKRMKDYATGGIRHFYFMALDREVFIDATKKGGKGRFLNHSCNPNCFVAKWTIGKKMRMGIFAKRDIKANEELTFNYNVDRYGHKAQPCFCGEPNCVGFIGGKTQTDIGGMDDLYIDALGITEEVEARGLRGTKKKKSKKLDEDFMPTLQPIELEEVPKVSAAVRQAIQTRRILEKLLQRIQMTTNEEVRNALLRLHGFNLMGHILKEYPNDIRIITLDLEILGSWTLKVRNKVEDSKIEESVRKCASMREERISELATTLLDYWDSLELGYRIPRSAREAGEDGDRKRAAEYNIEHLAAKRARRDQIDIDEEAQRRPVFVKPEASVVQPPAPLLPAGWRQHHDPTGKAYFENTVTSEVQWDFPVPLVPKVVAPTPVKPKQVAPPTPIDVNAIIAQVQKDAEAVAAKEAAKVEEERRAAKDAARRRGGGGGGTPSTSRSNSIGGGSSKSETASKEKKVMALFSTLVVQVMSKYRGHLEPEQFKKRAREVTSLLCEKEKKHPLYASEPYDVLSAEKASKVKAFTKDWVKKLLDRKRSTNGGTGSGAATPSLTTPSPQTPSTSSAIAFASASSPFFVPPTPTASSSVGAGSGAGDTSSPRFPGVHPSRQGFVNGAGTPSTLNYSYGATNGGGYGSSIDPRRASIDSSVGRNDSVSSNGSAARFGGSGLSEEQLEMIGEMVAQVGNGVGSPAPSFGGGGQ